MNARSMVTSASSQTTSSVNRSEKQKRQSFYNSLSEAERKAFDEGAYCGW
uniref:Uncharacterized protein n=1 Tax=Cryptococcus bacillisporus CA1280 TaxID=1296109 RepID=A0A0D0TCS8_CRYGA|nr:hypothetical protein I312_06815 [Cryptococcus bacillisporus CA1280]